MALTPDEFHAHARTATDPDGRLPLSRMTYWEIAPFEPESLRVAPLRAPVLPEPPRAGEGGSACSACAPTDRALWQDEHWRLRRIGGVGVPLVLMLLPHEHFDLGDLPDDRAAELGVLTVHLARHVEALANVARAHVYRFGDGGAHLHVWFFARPTGQPQLLGSWLPVWDDLLPEYPDDVAQADADAVARALADSYGGSAG